MLHHHMDRLVSQVPLHPLGSDGWKNNSVEYQEWNNWRQKHTMTYATLSPNDWKKHFPFILASENCSYLSIFFLDIKNEVWMFAWLITGNVL